MSTAKEIRARWEKIRRLPHINETHAYQGMAYRGESHMYLFERLSTKRLEIWATQKDEHINSRSRAWRGLPINFAQFL